MAGTARRTKELAEEFVKSGKKVTVITSFPREYRSIPGCSINRYEVINGVDVYRINTIFSININVVSRIISYLAFVLFTSQWIIKRRGQFDLIISIAPIAAGIVGSIINKFYKIPHHFDIPDILPDLGIAAGMIKNKAIISIFYKVEKWVYNNCTTISAITGGQIRNIVAKGVNKEKISLIPDWVDSEFFNKNISAYSVEIGKELKSRFGNRKIISFIGNIGALQNPAVFLDLMKSLNANHPDQFQFLFIGDGIMLPELKRKVADENLKGVEFVGRIKRELIPAYMRSSDILIANYVNNNYMNICIPGKLYEYLISGSPIVIGARGEAADFISRYGAGIPVKPSNSLEMEKAVISISNSNNSISKSNLQKFNDKYNLSFVAKSYDRIFDLLR